MLSFIGAGFKPAPTAVENNDKFPFICYRREIRQLMFNVEMVLWL
jgi:hypothetical protein